MDNYEELKLEIFESAECGEITESEKKSLLETLDGVYESTAYNRKIDEYDKQLDDLYRKAVELRGMINKATDKEKQSISKRLEDLYDKIEDIKKKRKLLSDTELTSQKVGKTAGMLLSVANNRKDDIDANGISKKDLHDYANEKIEHGKRYKKLLQESVMDLYINDTITESDMEDTLTFLEAYTYNPRVYEPVVYGENDDDNEKNDKKKERIEKEIAHHEEIIKKLKEKISKIK